MSIQMIFLQVAATADTAHAVQTAATEASLTFGGIIDVAYKISMVAIAVFNIFYVIKLNRLQSQDKEAQRKAERRIDLLKTIVLIPNLRKMYSFLDKLWQQLERLKLEGENDKNTDKENAVKQNIEPEIQKLFASLRSDFIIALNATAPSLGKKVERVSDNMRDKLLENMSDPGINLWVTNYFNDRIKTVYENGKKEMVNVLFNYEGKE